MKKKIFSMIAAVSCALCCAFCTVACGDNDSSDKAQGADRVNDFVRVIDGVFTSAGFTKASRSAARTSAAESGTGFGSELSELYASLNSDGNTSSVGSDLNYLKCDSLYQGANLAGLFRSMAVAIGGDVFSNAYDLSKLDMQGYCTKIEYNDYYTLYGVERNGEAVVSAIQIDFKEYASGKFAFKLVQFDKRNDSAELHISCYDSDSAAFSATLKADLSFDFGSYAKAYSAFTVYQCRLVVYGNTQYVSGSSDSETIMKFAENTLKFNNSTYANLVGLANGKGLTDKQAADIYTEMSKNYYSNPYTQMSGGNGTGGNDNQGGNGTGGEVVGPGGDRPGGEVVGPGGDRPGGEVVGPGGNDDLGQ